MYMYVLYIPNWNSDLFAWTISIRIFSFGFLSLGESNQELFTKLYLNPLSFFFHLSSAITLIRCKFKLDSFYFLTYTCTKHRRSHIHTHTRSGKRPFSNNSNNNKKSNYRNDLAIVAFKFLKSVGICFVFRTIANQVRHRIWKSKRDREHYDIINRELHYIMRILHLANYTQTRIEF